VVSNIEVVGQQGSEVTVDTTANRPPLRLEGRRTGRVRFLDALELETIIRLPEGHPVRLLAPSADRWRDA